MLAWNRGFCRSSAASSVEPDRGNPAMKWTFEVMSKGSRGGAQRQSRARFGRRWLMDARKHRYRQKQKGRLDGRVLPESVGLTRAKPASFSCGCQWWGHLGFHESVAGCRRRDFDPACLIFNLWFSCGPRDGPWADPSAPHTHRFPVGAQGEQVQRMMQDQAARAAARPGITLGWPGPEAWMTVPQARPPRPLGAASGRRTGGPPPVC